MLLALHLIAVLASEKFLRRKRLVDPADRAVDFFYSFFPRLAVLGNVQEGRVGAFGRLLDVAGVNA